MLDQHGKHIGNLTNPELRKFGRKVVFPIDYRLRDNID